MPIKPQPTMMVPFVDLAAQYATIETEINHAMANVLKRTDFILGADVVAFEQEFAQYCSAAYAVGVDSGLTALELLLRAYHIGPGDEVILPANTFIATVLAVSSVGALPVLVDIEPTTYMIDVNQIEQAINSRTKAIIPVHLYGQVADMDAILEVADKHGLVVFEDASQAHGARYRGQRVGSLGNAAAFSLYPAKNLGAYGDAGILVTDDASVAQAASLLRNYGSVQKYHHEVIGGNHRLDTLHAAVLRVKLRYLDTWNEVRRRHALAYTTLLQGSRVICPSEPADTEPVYHLYVIRTPQRNALQRYLQERGISTVIHYPVPIHLQPAYRSLGYSQGDFPVTEKAANEILSLPLYTELPPQAIEYVATTIYDFERIQTRLPRFRQPALV